MSEDEPENKSPSDKVGGTAEEGRVEIIITIIIIIIIIIIIKIIIIKRKLTISHIFQETPQSTPSQKPKAKRKPKSRKHSKSPPYSKKSPEDMAEVNRGWGGGKTKEIR